MLNKFFAKPIELTLGEQVLKFCSISDFEFCVAGRTSVPSRKIIDLVKFNPSQLKKEARTIKDIENRFVAILSRSIEDPASINRSLRELDPLIFSQDHDWRDIVAALNNGGDELNAFRRIALVKYMQYLSARQEIIKYVYSEKTKLVGEPAPDAESAASNRFKDTIVLENTLFEPVPGEAGKESDFQRMPKGEAVKLTFTPGQEIELLLSKHRCKLVHKDKLQFIDQTGRSYELRQGRNIIGRDTVSTVMIDPALRDVSRLHLMIENIDGSTLQLTDMSSHGTSLPPACLSTRTSPR